MNSPHQDHLFSAAYDQLLPEDEAQNFSQHLEQCSECTTKFQAYSQALEALKTLPTEPMPAPIHLPEAPPRGGFMWWKLFTNKPLVGWGSALGAAAAAVLISLALRGGPTNSVSHNNIQALAQPSSNGESNNSAAGAFSAPRSANCSVQDLDMGLAVGEEPTTFSYSVVKRIVDRPGEELVLGSTSNHFSPGSVVPIYAVLKITDKTSGVGRALVPCVSLVGRQFSQPITPNSRAASQIANGVPIQSLLVPTNVAPGSVLQVKAEVPAGVPNHNEPALEATFTITIE